MKALKILNQFSSFKALNQQLEQYTKNQQTKLAGDIFELAVKLYLQTNPKYRTKLKNVWLLKEIKENIKQKLNLPNEDEGIDLIAETYDKRYWAIQAIQFLYKICSAIESKRHSSQNYLSFKYQGILNDRAN